MNRDKTIIILIALKVIFLFNLVICYNLFTQNNSLWVFIAIINFFIIILSGGLIKKIDFKEDKNENE